MKLPLVSSDKVLKLLSKKGFSIVRQKGSHISLHKEEEGITLLVVVPKKDQIKIGTLISILKQAKITREEFLNEIK
ncbi:type II toxin-antitoxin system HicA family toxin [Candidatus Woesearchaeota archaeon]|nr:type II toxin-antitoxin system HicA family toxin [Candidatus Woesearchaeota archaeon]